MKLVNTWSIYVFAIYLELWIKYLLDNSFAVQNQQKIYHILKKGQNDYKQNTS